MVNISKEKSRKSDKIFIPAIKSQMEHWETIQAITAPPHYLLN